MSHRPHYVQKNLNSTFVGQIEYEVANSKIIKYMHQVDAKLRYAGEGRARKSLESLSSKLGYKNISFTGQFLPSEKRSIYEITRFSLSCYGNNNKIVTTSLPNKLYDSMAFKIPIIVNSGTYLASIVKNYNLGIIVNLDNLDGLWKDMESFHEEGESNIFLDGSIRFLSSEIAYLKYFKESIIFTIRNMNPITQRSKE